MQARRNRGAGGTGGTSIIIELNTRDDILYPVSNELREIFKIFNCSLTVAIHRTTPLLLSVETKNIDFKEVLERL